jgi:hypothetical protein
VGEMRNAYKILVGNPEGKSPFGRPRRRWEENIRMDLRKMGLECVDWIHLVQDRDQWRASRVTIKFSRRNPFHRVVVVVVIVIIVVVVVVVVVTPILYS